MAVEVLCNPPCIQCDSSTSQNISHNEKLLTFCYIFTFPWLKVWFPDFSLTLKKVFWFSPWPCPLTLSLAMGTLFLTLKVLNFWKFTSHCSLRPLWSGMGEVVLACTSPTLHPPSPPTVHQLSQLALKELTFFLLHFTELTILAAPPHGCPCWLRPPPEPYGCPSIVPWSDPSRSCSGTIAPSCWTLCARRCPTFRLSHLKNKTKDLYSVCKWITLLVIQSSDLNIKFPVLPAVVVKWKESYV